jgi:hypothetical protein
MDVNMERIFSVVNTAPVREAMPKSEGEVQPAKDGYFAQHGEFDPSGPMSLKDKAVNLLFKGLKKEIQALNKEMIAKDNKETDKDPVVGQVDSLEKLGKASKAIKGLFNPETKEIDYNKVIARLEPALEAQFFYDQFQDGIIGYAAGVKVGDSPLQTSMSFAVAPSGKITYVMVEGTPPTK